MRLHSALQPIRRRLPLFISALLVAVVAVFSWAAYRQIERALLLAGGEHARSASLRLSAALDESARRIRTDVRRLAADSALVRYLTHRDSRSGDLARARLEKQLAVGAQTLGFEIRDRKNQPLDTVGSLPPHPGSSIPAVTLTDTSARGAWLGDLYSHGDTAFYEILGAVANAAGDTVGYLAQYRRVNSGQSAQLIGGLIGSEALVYFGNARGGAWTDLTHVVAAPAVKVAMDRAFTLESPDGRQRLAGAEPIGRTPWVLLVAIPRAVVLAPARALLGRLLALAGLVVLAGTIGAWLVSRQITTPLAELTEAAGGLAGGDYSRRVVSGRRDEIGLLADSFNAMAAQVADSTLALEIRVAERTRELERALGELKSAQEELLKRERLATLGHLAGGVGHELRNPLGVMTNALYFLTAVLKDAPAQVQEYLGILRTQIGMSEKIVGDLLDFARAKPPRTEPTDLAQVAAEQLQRAGPREGVTVRTDIAADLPHAQVDRSQLGQVLLNLITNAYQAMPETGGTLTLRGRRNGGRQLLLDVIDTGSGIAPEHLEKVFEPLFTTKARGIGLGLSVSRTLARANGGDITVTSKPGTGTTFTVHVPAAAMGGAR